MCLAAVASGADGLILEVHCNPAEALSDGDQSLSPEMFADTSFKIRELRHFLDHMSPAAFPEPVLLPGKIPQFIPQALPC
jgi:3-deoxy-D-manno-octulosonic acid (KDO) 8-phosphate synthase